MPEVSGRESMRGMGIFERIQVGSGLDRNRLDQGPRGQVFVRGVMTGHRWPSG